MPNVPIYQPDQVATRPITDAKVANVSVDNGAGIGRAAQAIGSGLQGLETNLQAQAELNQTTAAKQLDNAFAEKARARLYDPDAGYLTTTKGQAAMDAHPAVISGLQQDANDILDTAQTPMQRRLAGNVIAARMNDMQAAVDRHAGEGRQQWLTQQSEGRVYSLSQDAALSFNQPPPPPDADGHQAPTPFANAMMGIDHELEGQALREHWDGDFFNMKRQQAHSQVHQTVVQGLLAQQQPDQAASWLQDHRADLEAKTYNTLYANVKTERDKADALKFNMALTGSGATSPGGFGTPVGKQFSAPPAGANTTADQIRALTANADPEHQQAALLFAAAESSFNPNAKQGSSTGLYQFQPPTWGKVSSGDINSVSDQVPAFLKLYDQNKAYLDKSLGRTPSMGEIYLAHQQGPAQAAALLSNPTAPAVDTIAPIYEKLHPGQGERMAVAAISANGGNVNMTSAEFADHWVSRFAKGAATGLGVTAQGQPADADGLPPHPDKGAMEAMAIQMGGGDADRTAHFLTSAREAYSQAEASRAQIANQANDAIQAYVQNPAIKSYTQVPAAIWSRLEDTKKTEYMKFWGDGGSFAKRDDPEVLGVLSNASTKESFAGINLVQYAGKMTKETYQKYLDIQRDIHMGTGAFADHANNVNTILSVAKPQMAAVGLTEKASPQDYNIFTGALIRAAETYSKANDGKPIKDLAAIHNMVDTLMLQQRWQEVGPDGKPKTGLFGGASTVTGPGYRAPASAPFNPVIDPKQRDYVISQMKQRGMVVTPQSVNTYYARLHALGAIQ